MSLSRTFTRLAASSQWPISARSLSIRSISTWRIQTHCVHEGAGSRVWNGKRWWQCARGMATAVETEGEATHTKLLHPTPGNEEKTKFNKDSSLISPSAAEDAPNDASSQSNLLSVNEVVSATPASTFAEPSILSSEIKDTNTTTTTITSNNADDGLDKRARDRAQHQEYKAYLSKLRRLCRTKDVDEGVKIVKEMQDNGHVLDVEAQQLRMYLMLQANRAEEMARVLEEMKESGRMPGEGHYSLLVTAFARLGRSRDALLVGDGYLREMEQRGIETKSRSYNELVKMFAMQKELKTAVDLFNEMVTRGLGVDESTLVDLFSNAHREPIGFDMLRLLRLSARVLSPAEGAAVSDWFHSQDHMGVGWRARRVVATASSGRCLGCGVMLESIELPVERQHRLESALRGWVDLTPLAHFSQWLDRKGHVDVVVDGLNIGYWKRPQFQGGQVEAVVRMFQAQNKNVVVLARSHVLTTRSELSRAAMNRLDIEGLVYLIDNNAKDDNYFLYAAVRGGMNVELVTNDELRDHLYRFSQQAGGEVSEDFRKWQRGHQVRVDIIDTPNGTEYRLQPRRVYDTITQTQRSRWHVPVSDGTFLCCAHGIVPMDAPPSHSDTLAPPNGESKAPVS